MDRLALAAAYAASTLICALAATWLGMALVRRREAGEPMTLLLVIGGGAAGAVARYLTDAALRARYGSDFPRGTLVANVARIVPARPDRRSRHRWRAGLAPAARGRRLLWRAHHLLHASGWPPSATLCAAAPRVVGEASCEPLS